MLKKILSNKYLLFLLRIIVGFIFIYSAAEKVADPAGFSQSIANYKILPDFLINFFAISLPWIELIAGLFLLFGIAVKENAFIINALLIIFILAISISLIRGLNIDCGCFGTSDGSKIGAAKLIENFLTLFAGIILMIFDSELFSVRNGKEKSNVTLNSF